MFPRENYLNKIHGFCHDDGMIKVIIGVRRCGKSCLMRCIAEELRPEGGFSVFITGSNSYLLPGELATKLSGRYIEFGMKTLDSSEHCQMKRFFELPVNPGPVVEFNACILEGGLPEAMDYSGLADNRINYGPSSRTSPIATLARRTARSASGALESWNATSSSENQRWATHTFRSQ